MENRKIIHVSAACIVQQHKLFACERGYGNYKGYWEFPGGKQEKNEKPEQALKREIEEELECRIQIEKKLCQIEYDYPEFHLVMDCFLCRLDKEKPHLLEHLEAKWLTLSTLYDVNWLEADLQVLDYLKSYLN